MKSWDLKRWALPSALGLAILGGLFWVTFRHVRLRPPNPPSPQTAAITPTVTFSTIANGRSEVRDLLDLEPLFLPTAHNTSVLALPPQALHEPGSMSFTYPAKPIISDSSGGVPLTEAIAVPSQPVEVLNLGEPPNPFPEVGRADVPVMTLEHRMAYIEIEAAKTGQTVIAEAVFSENNAVPPADDWMPFQFMVAVDAAGLVGAPVTTGTTASEEVETFFRAYLLKQFQLGARLPPGFYTVKIGP